MKLYRLVLTKPTQINGELRLTGEEVFVCVFDAIKLISRGYAEKPSEDTTPRQESDG